MGQRRRRGRERGRQAGSPDRSEARSRALCMQQIIGAPRKLPQANWLSQVLLAIMSGVFGLAGWHFCEDLLRILASLC
jgi:hypothetical protein